MSQFFQRLVHAGRAAGTGRSLADRWQVVGLLQRDLPYRRIHDMTGVSVTTIGRVARFLSDGFGGYVAAIEHRSHKHPSPKNSASH